MNISLPDAMRAHVEAEVATGRYANSSDFIRDLIRDHQERREELRTLLIEADASGRSNRTFDEIVAEARKDFRSRSA